LELQSLIKYNRLVNDASDKKEMYLDMYEREYNLTCNKTYIQIENIYNIKIYVIIFSICF
jgi:hypothetical protein